MGKRDEILSLFPDGLKGRMKPVLEDVEHLNEIRLGVNRPCRIIREGCEYFLSQDGTCLTQGNNTWLTSDREIESIVNQMCSYSLYAFENELRQGFLTVQGGHRIGFAGKVILNTDGSVRNFSCIRFLNIRISHEILGMADPVLPYLFQQGELWNTLIISPPGCGKTTLLRDLIRQVSDGTDTRQGQQVSVVDERSEIAGSYQGIPQNQVGIRTDVLDACPKTEGMMLLVRSMTWTRSEARRTLRHFKGLQSVEPEYLQPCTDIPLRMWKTSLERVRAYLDVSCCLHLRIGSGA